MKPQVVVIGGGTGIYPVVNALRRLPVECSTIINASDSGGSTGRIRDEFGFPPVGDLRQSLAALADPSSQQWIRQLLLYRFNKGGGLRGHNLGNLILTALQDMTGSTSQSLEIAAKIFRIHGRVIPVTEQAVELEVTYTDGTTVIGEAALDDPAHTPHKKIITARLVPAANLNPLAFDAINNANWIVIGPGDYYGSLQSVLLVDDIKAAFAGSQAKLVYVVNLMTRPTQTKDMTARDHVVGIESQLGRPVDTIVINADAIPAELLSFYTSHDEWPVQDDLMDDPRVVRAEMLATVNASDQLRPADTQRSLLRHDEEKVVQLFQSLIKL